MIGQVFKGLAMEAEQALAELLLSVWGEVLSPPEEAPCSPRCGSSHHCPHLWGADSIAQVLIFTSNHNVHFKVIEGNKEEGGLSLCFQ